jgi:hypothetical protein
MQFNWLRFQKGAVSGYKQTQKHADVSVALQHRFLSYPAHILAQQLRGFDVLSGASCANEDPHSTVSSRTLPKIATQKESCLF